jgi:predicted TIM-barrel fold metal-dependent hydrolase
MVVVDTHAHIWRPAPAGSSPLETIVSGEADISAEMLRTCLDQHGVDRAVLVQPVYPGEDNSYVADTAAREPDKFAAVCVVDPRKPEAADRLAYWVSKRGCRGLRLRPRIASEQQSFGDRATFPLWEAAQRLGIVVSVLCEFEHLGAVATMAGSFPPVPIVIDHLALPPMPIADAQMQPLLNLSQFPRVYPKLSGFYYVSSVPYPHADCHELVRAVYERFGPDRLLWGSDFPHVTARSSYGQSLAMVEKEFTWLTDDDRKRVLGENAVRLYWPEVKLDDAAR